METAKIRNVILLGHSSSGKTSLVEAFLNAMKITTRMGTIASGNTVGDYQPDEIERKITLNAKIINFNVGEYRINTIDTPGYLDFIGDVLGCVKVVDAAILLVDAVSGIEVGTERFWELLEAHKIPRFIFINKLDKENANFVQRVSELREKFGKNCVPIAWPVGKESGLSKVVSFFDRDFNAASIDPQCEAFHKEAIETIAESNDALLDKYLNGETLSAQDIRNGLTSAVKNLALYPILAGAATSGVGVKELLQEIAEVMPDPSQHAPFKAQSADGKEIEIKTTQDAPFTAFVFKTISDPYVGQLNVFKVLSGRLSSDSEFYNASKSTSERFGPLYFLRAKEQITTKEAVAGDIVAVAKLKETQTSDTLCDKKNPVLCEPVTFPEPAISFSIKPNSRQDDDQIMSALHKVVAEDSTFKFTRDPQTKELIVSGMGDLHLDVVIDRMRKRYGVDVEVGTPKVPYKETVKKAAKVQGKYKKQTGGRGQYGDVWIELEPLPRGGGFEFVDKIVGGAIPRNFIPSVEKGIRNALPQGALAGFPVVDVRVTLYDGSYHDVDSSDIAFQIAGSMAFKKAQEQAVSVLLEPIMEVEVVIPEEYMGQITGDLNGRRGRIMGMDVGSKNQIIKAHVPLAEMFKYAGELKSMTGGRGSYSMRFGHYEEVPSKLAAPLVERFKATVKEEAEV